MDKTALITGAANRIGAEISRHLHRDGFRVAIHYNTSAAAAEKLATSLNDIRPESAFCIQGNLNLAETSRALVDEVAERWGRLDVLVNNASVYEPSDAGIPDVDLFEALIVTNLRAPYLLSGAAVPLLRESRGTIINLTDISASRPQPGYAVYCASKAGLIGLTKALARDLAPLVRVNGVSPGAIIWAEEETLEHREVVIQNTPLARLGKTSDIAQAVSYLVSAPYVTGHILEIDGGRSIHI
ncbi:MAG: pteridine reductase [Gammaproteobacteria bacterium]